ncbi:hypothetical protein AAVH_14757 [Aphelenchoides avenae]|nr:hypothetical protein AAVH_14757 [Aphelenchus avenae]
MYRSFCVTSGPKCEDSLQTVVLAVSPVYAEFLDDVVEDLLGARFGILKKKQIKLTEAEVSNWFLDSLDADNVETFADCTSTFFLVAKQGAIAGGQELARFHNGLSIAKLGKRAVYVSACEKNVARDVQLYFPEYASMIKKKEGSQQARRTSSHLIQPLSGHLAELGLNVQAPRLINSKTPLY